MKKLFICASLFSLFGANAQANLTIINNVEGQPGLVQVRVNRHNVEDQSRVIYGTPWSVDVSGYPAHTYSIEVVMLGRGEPCILHINAHQTLAQVNTKTIKFGNSEENNEPYCAVLDNSQSSPKPTK